MTDTSSVRVVGVFAALTLAQRQKRHEGDWKIAREPSNSFDANAIAVFIGKTKIGYLSSAKAKSYAAPLDSLGGEYVVSGKQEGIIFHVDLPDLAQFRRLATQAAS